MAERTFWRIVRTNPPTRRDFMSHIELGIPFRAGSEEVMRQVAGISVYATEVQARRKARQVPVLGVWLAELRIDDDRGFVIARTHGGPDHHTIWSDPDEIMSCDVRVIDV